MCPRASDPLLQSPCGESLRPGAGPGSLPPGTALPAPRYRFSHPLRAKERRRSEPRPVLPQAFRDQVRCVPAGHPAHAGGAPRPGLRVPPALLRLRRVQAAAGHGRRVLSHGGQPARVQGRLRDGQTARSVGGAGAVTGLGLGTAHLPPSLPCKAGLRPVRVGCGQILPSSVPGEALTKRGELKRLLSGRGRCGRPRLRARSPGVAGTVSRPALGKPGLGS